MKYTDIKLYAIFSFYSQYWFVLLIIAISLNVSAIQPCNHGVPILDCLTQDSLVIKRNNGNKKYIIEKGRIIKIWIGEETVKGEFFGLCNDTFSINKQGVIKKYNVSHISKIKLYGNVVRFVIGGVVKIWGGSIVVAGFVPVFSWGTVGLIISIPAWAVGWGIYEIGKFISGRKKFNLEKKWNINQIPN